jgi:hypothetical protein
MVDFSKAKWRKSTYSMNNGCVEVAFVGTHVAVRNSKDRMGLVLLFTTQEWTAFLRGVHTGEFDKEG